ncbi:MAG: septum formation initiator family protein [Eubacterium sp.]
MVVRKKTKMHRRYKPKLGSLIVVLVILIFVGTLFGSNAMQIYKLNQQKKEISQQIENENKRGEQLDEDVEQIGTKNYIEEVARKYLKLFYPNEKIVVPVKGEENNGQNKPADTSENLPADNPKQNTVPNQNQSEGN